MASNLFNLDIGGLGFWLSYLIGVMFLRRWARPGSFPRAFAVLNVYFYLWLALPHRSTFQARSIGIAFLLFFGCWLIMRKSVISTKLRPAAIVAPIAVLCAFRGLPISYLFGVSFISFRLSYLALEVNRGLVAPPGILDYLGYAFFPITAPMGPVSSYAEYAATVASPMRLPRWPLLLRFGWGLTKLYYFGYLLYAVSFDTLLFDGHGHGLVDVSLSCAAYYLTIYARFSGFCDIMISLAALTGIRLKENFRDPLLSRNPQDHWRRWHISLMDYMRDVVFVPASLHVLRRWGPRAHIAAVVSSIFLVFLLISAWHGLEWHYLAFGLYHGAGVSWTYIYDRYLRKVMGKSYETYMRSRWVLAVSWFFNFWFIAYGYFLYGNSDKQILYLLKEVLVFAP